MAHTQYDILVLNAHPDDSEMAMGGTLLKLIRAGYSILNVSLTKGQAGTAGSSEIRTTEFHNAQKFLGCDGLLLEHQDTKLEINSKIIQEVALLIRLHKPKVVFAPYRKNDAANFDGMHNRDHSICGEIASQAIKIARLKNAIADVSPHVVNQLFFYMIPVNFFPQLLFDVSDVKEDIGKLISHYASQISNNNLLELLFSIRKTHGAINRTEYAEAFITEMPLRMNAQNIFNL